MKKLNPDDYIGKSYGKLTIIKYIGYENNNHFFTAKCNCEFETIKKYRLSDLKSKKGTKSCGMCSRIKHGKSGTRLYRIWKGMKQRCYNPNMTEYENYGGKGVIVCDEWKNNFINFYNWSINNGYNHDLEIDRKEVDGNYEPNNCQFITKSENITKANFQREYKGNRTVKGINSKGEEFIFENIREFARQHNLDASAISKVCNKEYKHHKGWKFIYID